MRIDDGGQTDEYERDDDSGVDIDRRVKFYHCTIRSLGRRLKIEEMMGK